MRLDPQFDTVLVMTCRCCGHVTRYLVPEGDAIATEAAFADQLPVLSFQCADAEGQLRTTNVRSDDFRSVQKATLTAQELAELRRRKPLPSVDMIKMLPGASKPGKIGGR